MSDISEWTNQIHQGDARSTLAEMPDSSVHMCMTSPPYYGLRDYGESEQIGLEDSLDKYIKELVAVGDALRDVLRDDGSWWLNLGDSYENKQKQLVPHKVAIALQDTGWIIRNDVTWAKPNPMPASVKDRLNTVTEQIFHLTPHPDYYYDLDSIREPHAEASIERQKHSFEANINRGGITEREDMQEANAPKQENMNHPQGKNPGDVFEVVTQPFPDAHFAVYPPELCQKPIKATCPKEVCADCGDPDNCDCPTDKTHGGIALDPFAGVGTTCMVARELQRRFVGIDLNPEYVSMAQKRLGLTIDNPTHIRDDEQQQGIETFLSD